MALTEAGSHRAQGDTVTAAQDASRVFRRVGEVTARRLEEDLAWVTQRGDRLQGHAGDWVVESLDGGQRTVKHEEFLTLYEPIGGDRWRRTGTVTAHQVSTPVTVSTLEGVARAEPGDWIVTAPDGSSWPVPDEVSRRSYEPV